MEWFTGLALLPALVCGGMMLGGAALGLRRTAQDTDHTAPTAARPHTDDRVPGPAR
jgi:hypothetical protein